MFLLDTNVCIDFSLGRSEAIRDRMRQHHASGLAISTITLAELRVGARHRGAEPKDEQRLNMLVATLAVRDFDTAAAQDYGLLARQVGVQRASFDRLIAAHARALGLTLVTNDARHFADVPGLSVENWAV